MEQKLTPMEIVTITKMSITITLDKEKADWVNASIDSIADAYNQARAEERERETVYQCSCCGFRSDGIFRIHDCEWTN